MTVTESLTDRVPISAEIRRRTDPHRPAERTCPECGQAPPAGTVRHSHCMKRLLLDRIQKGRRQ